MTPPSITMRRQGIWECCEDGNGWKGYQDVDGVRRMRKGWGRIKREVVNDMANVRFAYD